MNGLFPLKLSENRVWRIYLGGKLLDAFRGKQGTDGCFPEDWIASVVDANNPPREDTPEFEGLSKTCDGSYLRDIIEQSPSDMLGDSHTAKHGNNFGVLTKFLDSAERLPIQVHPDKQAARRLFNSDYGKTEAWYILGGRQINGEEPHILMGFKQAVTPEQLRELFDRQDIAGMAALMHKIPVKEGEVYIIKGGTPHAIGPGCLILEIQEPTDYTISLEKCNTLGERLPDFLCHQGIGFDKMFECFHYVKHSPEGLLDEFKLSPKVVEDNGVYRLTSLIDYSDTPCFALNRIDVFGDTVITRDSKPCAYVVVCGEGKICGQSVKQGESLFVPAACGEIGFEVFGTLSVLECLPPQ